MNYSPEYIEALNMCDHQLKKAGVKDYFKSMVQPGGVLGHEKENLFDLLSQAQKRFPDSNIGVDDLGELLRHRNPLNKISDKVVGLDTKRALDKFEGAGSVDALLAKSRNPAPTPAPATPDHKGRALAGLVGAGTVLGVQGALDNRDKNRPIYPQYNAGGY